MQQAAAAHRVSEMVVRRLIEQRILPQLQALDFFLDFFLLTISIRSVFFLLTFRRYLSNARGTQ